MCLYYKMTHMEYLIYNSFFLSILLFCFYQLFQAATKKKIFLTMGTASGTYTYKKDKLIFILTIFMYLGISYLCFWAILTPFTPSPQ